MTTRITLFICDKDSDKINVRNFPLTNYEETKPLVDEIFAEANQQFSRYFYDCEADTDLTDEERELLRKLNIDEELM